MIDTWYEGKVRAVFSANRYLLYQVLSSNMVGQSYLAPPFHLTPSTQYKALDFAWWSINGWEFKLGL